MCETFASAHLHTLNFLFAPRTLLFEYFLPFGIQIQMQSASAVHDTVLRAIEKACAYYIRETNFGIGSWYYHGEQGRHRSQKIKTFCQHAMKLSPKTNVHWIVALACLESEGRALVDNYIAPFIAWSGIFTLDEMHANMKRYEGEVNSLTNTVRTLVNGKLDITTIGMSDRLRTNINDEKAEDQQEILKLLEDKDEVVSGVRPPPSPH